MISLGHLIFPEKTVFENASRYSLQQKNKKQKTETSVCRLRVAAVWTSEQASHGRTFKTLQKLKFVLFRKFRKE